MILCQMPTSNLQCRKSWSCPGFLILVVYPVIGNTVLPPLPGIVPLLCFCDTTLRFCPSLADGSFSLLHCHPWGPHSCIQMTTERKGGKKMMEKCSRRQKKNSKMSKVTEAKKWASFRKETDVDRIKWLRVTLLIALSKTNPGLKTQLHEWTRLLWFVATIELY